MSLYPDNEPTLGAAPAKPAPAAAAEWGWREYLVPHPPEAECLYRLPGGGPLLLSYDGWARYCDIIGYTGDDDADCPASPADCAALLFFASHAAETWSVAMPGHLLALRLKGGEFLRVIDAWAAAVLGPQMPDYATVRALAVAVWREARGGRPVPVPDDGDKKKVTS